MFEHMFQKDLIEMLCIVKKKEGHYNSPIKNQTFSTTVGRIALERPGGVGVHCRSLKNIADCQKIAAIAS